jgi:hypothetical protein
MVHLLEQNDEIAGDVDCGDPPATRWSPEIAAAGTIKATGAYWR